MWDTRVGLGETSTRPTFHNSHSGYGVVKRVDRQAENGTVTHVPELLFSYGTLRQRDVQLSTFGRELNGSDDAIVGYRLDWVTITDPHVVETSGSDRHPILKSGTPEDAVDGSVFEITDAELVAADEYEVDDYQRVQVPLRSGRQAWVYVFAG